MLKINRPVIVFENWKKEKVIGEAKFLGFGVMYEEFAEGFAPFTTAIVEYKDGCVDLVIPSQIQFLDNEVKGNECKATN